MFSFGHCPIYLSFCILRFDPPTYCLDLPFSLSSSFSFCELVCVTHPYIVWRWLGWKQWAGWWRLPVTMKNCTNIREHCVGMGNIRTRPSFDHAKDWLSQWFLFHGQLQIFANRPIKHISPDLVMQPEHIVVDAELVELDQALHIPQKGKHCFLKDQTFSCNFWDKFDTYKLQNSPENWNRLPKLFQGEFGLDWIKYRVWCFRRLMLCQVFIETFTFSRSPL